MNLATVSRNPFFARRDTFALCCARVALQPCFAKDASAALWSPEGIWGLRQCWVNWWSWECNWRLADSTNGMGHFFGPYCWRNIGSHDVCAVRLAMSTQTETSGEPCTAIRARVPRGHVPNYSRPWVLHWSRVSFAPCSVVKAHYFSNSLGPFDKATLERPGEFTLHQHASALLPSD